MNLPFELSTAATTKWLQSLSHLNSANAANQLNKVIKELRTTTSVADEILKILTKLTPTILFIISNIESSLLSKETSAVNNNSQKIEQLCIQLLRNLSLAFYSFTSNESLSAEEKKQAIFLTLQLIGLAQRSAAIYHQFSSSTLWQITSELYTLSVDENILHQNIDHTIKDFKNQTTIENVLKRNLLFTLLSPYQHTSKQIKELFSMAEQHAHLLDLKKEDSTDTIFAWKPESLEPPYTKNVIQAKNNTLIINTSPLLLLIQSESFSSQLNKDTLKLITEKLSGFSETINPLTSTLLINNIFIGFNDITEYLEKTEKLNKIEQLSSQLVEQSPQKDAIFANNQFDSSPLPAQSNSRNELLANSKSVKILQTQNKQFIIAETSSINCSIGDIILLCSSHSNHQLGIIRQTKITNESGTLHILIETISGTVSFQQIESPKTTETKLISIQKEESEHEVLLAPCKLSNGTQIQVTSNKKFTLNSLIDYSPSFMHYHTS